MSGVEPTPGRWPDLRSYGTTSGAAYADGNLDLDEDVDLSDLAALLSVYGTVCP